MAARAALGLNDAPLVLCVGRLVPRKGQDMLIAALAALDGAFPDVRLALVGGGRLADELHRRAAAAGLAERIHLPGEVTDAELSLWLQAADVFAGPSRTRFRGLEVEGFGIVYAEAALTGLPVVRRTLRGSSLRLWSRVRPASWSTPIRPTSSSPCSGACCR